MASVSFPRPGHNGGSLTNWDHELLTRNNAPDGVYGGPTDGEPVIPDTTSTRMVKVRSNVLAHLTGSFYWSGDTDIPVGPLAANTSGQPRIDRIVLRLDRSTYQIKEHILLGTPATNPVAPALRVDGGPTGMWDFPLADVRVEHNATTIGADKITRRCWYIGDDGQIRCRTSTRPYHQQGRSAWDIDIGAWIVSNGSKWLKASEDTGWINITPASGWRTNFLRIRRLNGTAFLQIDLDRSGPDLPATTPNLICTLPAGFEPDVDFFAPAAIWNAQLSGRVMVLRNRRVELSAHPAIPTNRYFIANPSWPVG